MPRQHDLCTGNSDAAQQQERGRHPEQVVKLGRGAFFSAWTIEMVEIQECDTGYQVKGREFDHTFSDRSKALLAAELVALKQATDEGQDVRIFVPATWGDETLVEHCPTGRVSRLPPIGSLARAK